MSVFSILREALEGVDGLSGHVYPTAAPEGAGKTHLVYVLERREDILCLDKPTGLSECWFRLHIISERYGDMSALCDRVKAVIVDMPRNCDGVLDTEWTEPDSEGYEEVWGVNRRSPLIKILFNEGV